MSLGSRSRVRTGRLSHWTETEVLQFARQIPNPLTGCSAWLSILLTHPSYPCALQASYCNWRFLGTSGASELSPGHEHLHSRTGRARGLLADDSWKADTAFHRHGTTFRGVPQISELQPSRPFRPARSPGLRTPRSKRHVPPLVSNPFRCVRCLGRRATLFATHLVRFAELRTGSDARPSFPQRLSASALLSILLRTTK